MRSSWSSGEIFLLMRSGANAICTEHFSPLRGAQRRGNPGPQAPSWRSLDCHAARAARDDGMIGAEKLLALNAVAACAAPQRDTGPKERTFWSRASSAWPCSPTPPNTYPRMAWAYALAMTTLRGMRGGTPLLVQADAPCPSRNSTVGFQSMDSKRRHGCSIGYMRFLLGCASSVDDERMQRRLSCHDVEQPWPRPGAARWSAGPTA